MKQTKIIQLKEQQFGLIALTLCGVLSLAGFASAATFTWVGPDSPETYYATEQLHAAAPVSSFPIAWFIFSLAVGVVTFFCAYKLLMKRKNHQIGHK